MELLVLASGSGGHVYPALSFIDYAKKSETITYLQLKNGFETRFKLDGVTSITMDLPNQFKKYIKNPMNFKKMHQEIKRYKHTLKRVDAVICFGGFVSFLGLVIAKKYHKPLFLHEQNSSLGDGNGVASLFAKKVFTTFELSNPKIINKKFMNLGNPRMDDAKNKNFYINKKDFNVLFFAGSLSSSSLNKIVKDLFERNFPINMHFYLISGEKQKDYFAKLKSSQVEVITYQEDMLKLMNNMDLVIMRGGATSLSEVIALNKPAIIIPSPNVKHNHQKKNVELIQKADACVMIEEKNLSSELLFKNIMKLYSDHDLRVKLKSNLSKFNRFDVSKYMLEAIKNG